jgi:hypothetical protein
MSWRTLSLLCACGVLALSAAPACGGSAADPQSSAAGSAGHSGSGNSGNGARAGSAGSAAPTPITCGSKSCSGLVIPIQSFVVPPCCADAETSHCGLDSSVLATFGPTFAEACQPLAQPGTKDSACPASPATPVEGTGLSLSFPGCCRPNHTCGYQLDTIGGAFPLGLGCVDAAPFLDGEAPQACGDQGAAGAGGAGGDGSVAGAGGDSSVAGAGGDSSGAGAGGDSSGAASSGDSGSAGTSG